MAAVAAVIAFCIFEGITDGSVWGRAWRMRHIDEVGSSRFMFAF